MFDYVSFVINYVTAGLIGWAALFIIAMIYIVASFKTNPLYYKRFVDGNPRASGARVDKLGTAVVLVLWPYGFMRAVVNIDKAVRKAIEGDDAIA